MNLARAFLRLPKIIGVLQPEPVCDVRLTESHLKSIVNDNIEAD